MYTLKDAEKYSIVDNVSSLSSIYLNIQVRKCNNQTSEVTCADFGEQDQYLKNYVRTQQIILLTAINFIDYEDIVPYEGPVRHSQQVIDPFRLASLDLNRTTTVRYEIIEH